LAKEQKMAPANAAKRLELRSRRLLRVGGAHDALSARLVEQAGFPAVWLSGFGVSAAQLALPDANLVTLSESAEAARRVAASVTIPVIADGDNGFGDALNAARAVREYGRAGVAGVCLEDNAFPKRSSLYAGAPRRLVPVAEMCEKLAAARRAADAFGLFLIGRVESLIAGLGADDAISRANAYAEAGADALLIHARSFAPLRDIAAAGRVKKPLVVVPTLFPEITLAELAACRFAAVIYANQLLRAMVRAGQMLLERMLQAERLAEVDPLLCPVEEIGRLVHAPAEWLTAKPTRNTQGGNAPRSPLRRKTHAGSNGRKSSADQPAHRRRHHAPRR
jgi:phosphoenolpyruvate phosphomutase